MPQLEREIHYAPSEGTKGAKNNTNNLLQRPMKISYRFHVVWEVKCNLCVFYYKNNCKVRQCGNVTQTYGLFIDT